MPNGKRIAIAAGVLALAVLGVAAWRGWPHLRFWWLFEPLGLNAQGFLEFRHRPTGIVFVSLSGGKFWMGAQKDDPNGPNYDPEARPEEAPVHEATLSPFIIAKHEVTQSQWSRVMDTSPSIFKGADLPVEHVYWEDCQEFSKKAGLKLPTEAQWEYACRAGSPGPYAETDNLEDMGWFRENGGGRTCPVGQKQPNKFGLHDLQGNVMELCKDSAEKAFYSRQEAVGLDPICSADSGSRVMRGGAFSVSSIFARSAGRCSCPSGWRHYETGFRVVASPPP